MARRLRIEPYDPDAVDGDGDGIVQENTAWERPVGTRLLDEFGAEIRRGIMSTQRPARMRVIDQNGNDIPYVPSYTKRIERKVKSTPLGERGAPSLAEMGAEPLPTLADQGIQTIGQMVEDIDAIVNPQTITAPDAEDLPLPAPSMLMKLEASSPSSDYTGSNNTILFGALVFLTAESDPVLLEQLEKLWEIKYRKHLFTGRSGPDLEFSEFKNLVIQADAGFPPLPSLTHVSTSEVGGSRVLSPEELRVELQRSIHEMLGETAVRSALKDRVSRDLADHMTRGQMSEELRRVIVDDLILDLASNGPGVRAPRPRDYWFDESQFDLPISGFTGGRVHLSESETRSLIEWSVGGPRPLWLDSPETPDEYRIIYGAGVLAIRRNDDPSNLAPAIIPVASLPIYESDSVDVRDAKMAYGALASRISDHFLIPVTDPQLAEERQIIADSTKTMDGVLSGVNRIRHEHTTNTIGRSIASDFLSSLGDPKGGDLMRYQAIGSILDGRESSSNPYAYNSWEERLLILAASGLLKEDEMATLKNLAGWDFTSQPNWEAFSTGIQANLSPTFRRSHINTVRFGTRSESGIYLINRDSASSMVDASGAPISLSSSPQAPSLLLFLDDAISDHLRQLTTLQATNGSPELTRIIAEVTKLRAGIASSDPSDLTLTDLDEIGREIYGLTRLAVPGITDDDYLLRHIRDTHIVPTSEVVPRSDLAVVQLITERPAFHVMQKAASDLVFQWSITSNGDDPLAHALQETALKLFDLDPEMTVPLEGIYRPLPNSGKLDPKEFKALVQDEIRRRGVLFEHFLAAQYANTQEFFRRMDIQRMQIVRGMVLPDTSPYPGMIANAESAVPTDVIPVNVEGFPYGVDIISVLRPMSSFSHFAPSTMPFAGEYDKHGVLLFSDLPVHQILGTPLTGYGCLNEYEIVVIGRSVNARMYRTRSLSRLDIFTPPWQRS